MKYQYIVPRFLVCKKLKKIKKKCWQIRFHVILYASWLTKRTAPWLSKLPLKKNQKKLKKSLDKCVTVWYNTQALKRVTQKSETLARRNGPWKLNNDEIKKEPWNYFVSLEKLATVNSGITDYKKSANDVRAN